MRYLCKLKRIFSLYMELRDMRMMKHLFPDPQIVANIDEMMVATRAKIKAELR